MQSCTATYIPAQTHQHTNTSIHPSTQDFHLFVRTNQASHKTICRCTDQQANDKQNKQQNRCWISL